MGKVALATVADFLINIAAGWFGAGYGALFLAGPTFSEKIILLIVDIAFGIVCLTMAMWLRRRNKK